MDRIYIDRYTGHLTKSDVYLVDLTLKDGTVRRGLEPRRLFPLTNPDMFITFLDENEQEVAIVRDITELDDESAAVLAECFREYYRIPKITHIYRGAEQKGLLIFDVETDRGRTSFHIANRQHNIFCLGNRVLIRDSNDNRYEIPDYTKLDKISLHWLFPYV